MLKAVEDLSSTRKRLKIEIPADAIEKEIRDSLERVRQNTTIPGFRPGRAPMGLIEKRFGKKVEEDVLEKMIPRTFVDAVREAKITPVTDPVIEGGIDFKRFQPLSMTVTVEVLPEIGNLQYGNIRLKDIPVSVDDSDIDDVVRRLQEERATYEPSDGPVEMNDLVVLDYSVKEEGVEVKDQVFKVGGSMFPEGFSQGLIGRNKGSEFSIEAEFPGDYKPERLAGKRLNLDVVIKDVKKINLPEVDDELAKDLGVENLAELRRRISENILKAKKNEVTKIQKAEIIKRLVESHEFDLPESLVETEVDMLVSRAMTDSEQVEDAETLRQQMRPAAIRNVKASLLIEAIGEKEGVSINDDDVKNAIIDISRRLNVSPESLMKFYISRDGSLNGLKSVIFEDRVLDLILSKAEIEKGD